MGEDTFKGYASEFFQDYYFKTNSAKITYFASIQEVIKVSQLEKNKKYSILDLGCGNGILLNSIKQKGISGSFYGIDNSEEMIQLAKTLDDSIQFKLGDANKTFFKDEQFDYVFSRAVLQHLDYPKNMLEETFRILKKGGKFIILIPVKSWFGTIPRYFAKVFLKKSDQVTGNQYWSSEIVRMIRDSGFAIVNKTRFGGLFYALSGYGSGVKFPIQNKSLWESLTAFDNITTKIPVVKSIGLNLILVAKK